MPELPKVGQEHVDNDVGGSGCSSPTATRNTTAKNKAHITVKKEPGTASISNGNAGDSKPAEICVVIGGSGGGGGGGSRNSQTQGIHTPIFTLTQKYTLGPSHHSL